MTTKTMLNHPWRRVFWKEALLAALKGGACSYRAIERADASLKAYLDRMENPP